MLEDLQMLIGSNDTDINYLYYLIVKGGSYYDVAPKIDPIVFEGDDLVEDLDELFS